jgi:hypothetical protein
MMEDPDDRFGVSVERLRAAFEEHRGIIRAGCYVPTRREVATADADLVATWLEEWWWESPSLLIPDDDQIDAAIAVLRTRDDCDSQVLRELIEGRPPRAGPQGAGGL